MNSKNDDVVRDPIKLNAGELRDIPEEELVDALKALKRRDMYLIVENVYDTYNIGGLFRLADALAVKGLFLCGEMEIPPNHRIKKASVGTYKVVPWQYFSTASEAIVHVRSLDPEVRVYAVEQDARSIPYTQANRSLPVALVVGNETDGVMQMTLDLCDQILEIPMWGINKSLNVIVSGAIVAYSFDVSRK